MAGLLSWLGLGSSSAGTTTASTGAGTGLTGSWPAYDEATAREHHRLAQVSLPAAEYNPDGTRRLSPRPDPAYVSRSFWRS
ncbi:hypothetical protein [Kitasatospora cheerisanensis]|uniref:Uncharacterized protein n=1 Tax=Kitasatospora cheerisanensis KCTC 2395 TaxID=1348663 RepID=A0A066YR09_9ACTN|nr:hypothetical protein [Kitasatospora cheerisanensis]KDN80521.1 hypothetical protein KCH_77190 [Kitasatospora cheerisanensis KCTC 2395]